MALVNCPDCSTSVSDMAPACPKCGRPIGVAAKDVAAAGVPLMTTQETSKRLKVHILISAVLFWGGLLWMFGSMSGRTPGAPPTTGMSVAPLMMVIGFAWYVVTKSRIWWHHK